MKRKEKYNNLREKFLARDVIEQVTLIAPTIGINCQYGLAGKNSRSGN